MSCFLCQTTSAVERDPVDDLKFQLQLIQSIYPDAAYPTIVNRDGVLIATLLSEERLGIDLTATISAIQSASKHFSSILGFSGCHHMQISGDSQVFSLYSLHADYILVFFNNKANMSDTMELGDRLQRNDERQIVQELNKILATALEKEKER